MRRGHPPFRIRVRCAPLPSWSKPFGAIAKRGKDMSSEAFPEILDRQRYLPVVIGFIIAVVHFAITYMVAPATYDLGRNYFTALMLTAPSFILSLMIDSVPFIPEGSHFLFPAMLVKFLYIGFSSFFYGMIGSFLASNNRTVQWIAILLLCLLLFSGCCLIMLAGQLIA